LTLDNLDKVMAELVAVSRSSMSKREEAANLARIWGAGVDSSPALSSAGEARWAEFRLLTAAYPVRRRARWRRVA
jgi:hypothetical protein